MKMKWMGPLLILLSATLLIFQNCGTPLEEVQEESSTLISGYQLPYDFEMDTFAYMSCRGSATVNDNSFNVYLGSSRLNSGLKIDAGFLSQVSGKNYNQKYEILKNSDTVHNGQLSAIWVSKSNFHGIDFDTGTYAAKWSQAYDVLPPLDYSAVAKNAATMIETNSLYRSHLKGIESIRDSNFSVRMRMDWEGQGGTPNERVFANNDHSQIHLLLTVRESAAGSEFKVKTYGEETIAGKKYEMSLTNAAFDLYQNSYNKNGIAPRLLGSVKEYDLVSRNQSNWVCPTQLRFMVVRLADAKNMPGMAELQLPGEIPPPDTFGFAEPNKNVSELVPTPPPGLTKAEYYKMVRDVLPFEHWYVNFNQRYIVNRKPSENICYPSTKPVDYTGFDASGNVTTECDLTGTGNEEMQCPNFVSICYKN